MFTMMQVNGSKYVKKYEFSVRYSESIENRDDVRIRSSWLQFPNLFGDRAIRCAVYDPDGPSGVHHRQIFAKVLFKDYGYDRWQ